MTKPTSHGIIVLAALSALALAVVAGSRLVRAGGSDATADTLGKLHQANQKEIEMGKLAQDNGQSQQVKDFGKTLVQDHTAADQQVVELAKREQIDLKGSTPATAGGMERIQPGRDFDLTFAKAMLDDHQRAIGMVQTALQGSSDEALKKLLAEVLPMLQKHEQIARSIVTAHGRQT
jgi:putative membrane protein